MLYLFIFFCINLTINVAHPVFLMHIQSLLSGYAPAAHIHTEAHVTLAVTSASAVSLNEDINT